MNFLTRKTIITLFVASSTFRLSMHTSFRCSSFLLLFKSVLNYQSCFVASLYHLILITIFSCPISFRTLKCPSLHFYRINIPYVSKPVDIVLLCIQIPVAHTATRRTRLYFPSLTMKDWHHSRAWWIVQNTQFIGTEVMV